MRVSALIFIIFMFLVVSQANVSNYKEVTIADGRILGRTLTTTKNNLYFAFQDIPYATPPIGPLRLKEAVVPEKWEGVLNTTANRKICTQFNKYPKDERENEDCLVLSVYTPVDPDNEGSDLPVYIWIHGGSFISFAGVQELWGPDYFIDQGIIVVTINYRLGPLGFLSTQDGVIPENLGLKDQLLAIKWVNKNIDRFGGDSEKITIGGQSAGAASVGYHILNKGSEGLFRAAILESGSPLDCWGLQKKARHVAYELGSLLSAQFNDSSLSEELLSIVQSSTVEELKAAASQLTVTPDNMNCHIYTSILWAPVVETGDQKDAVVVGMNHEHLKSGDINRVPILIGINSQESLLFGTAGPIAMGAIIDASLNKSINANINMKEGNKFESGIEIRQIYTNDTFSSKPSYSINFVSDCMFNTPIARHAYLQSAYTDVYFYQFSYLGTLGRYVYYDIEGASGLAHQEELGYFWKNATVGDLSKFPKEDIVTHERVVELWSEFIKYSNPTAEKPENLEWSKVTPNDFFYLDIDSEFKIKQNPKNYLEYSSIYDKYAEDKLDSY